MCQFYCCYCYLGYLLMETALLLLMDAFCIWRKCVEINRCDLYIWFLYLDLAHLLLFILLKEGLRYPAIMRNAIMTTDNFFFYIYNLWPNTKCHTNKNEHDINFKLPLIIIFILGSFGNKVAMCFIFTLTPILTVLYHHNNFAKNQY